MFYAQQFLPGRTLSSVNGCIVKDVYIKTKSPSLTWLVTLNMIHLCTGCTTARVIFL